MRGGHEGGGMRGGGMNGAEIPERPLEPQNTNQFCLLLSRRTSNTIHTVYSDVTDGATDFSPKLNQPNRIPNSKQDGWKYVYRSRIRLHCYLFHKMCLVRHANERKTTRIAAHLPPRNLDSFPTREEDRESPQEAVPRLCLASKGQDTG